MYPVDISIHAANSLEIVNSQLIFTYQASRNIHEINIVLAIVVIYISKLLFGLDMSYSKIYLSNHYQCSKNNSINIVFYKIEIVRTLLISLFIQT